MILEWKVVGLGDESGRRGERRAGRGWVSWRGGGDDFGEAGLIESGRELVDTETESWNGW